MIWIYYDGTQVALPPGSHAVVLTEGLEVGEEITYTLAETSCAVFDPVLLHRRGDMTDPYDVDEVLRTIARIRGVELLSPVLPTAPPPRPWAGVDDPTARY